MPGMWHIMEATQDSYRLSDRLIRAVSKWGFDQGDEDITQLIEAGAEVNRLHGTLLPLHCACMVADSDVTELLINKGARVNDTDGYGRCAIHYAAEKDVDCIKVLLRHGANINQGDLNNDTALHWACYKCEPKCVRLLLKFGANINAADYNNDTPISWAARKGNVEVIGILLDFNANLDIKNFFGFTPLQRAASVQASGLNTEDDDDTLELLIKASGQFNLLDESGEVLRVVQRDSRLEEIMQPLCRHPRPLLQLCLHRIRKSLGPCYLPYIVPSLPVPRKVKEYLLLRHESPRYLRPSSNETDSD
ncbi:ankyrin repeat and SOCS box protein 8 [Aplysia californica]|uniref:Ankyrin repeat and SOCS box protein 8 n=1 Tax=Aplysia californica TaxID=6500 RepID=A0ABM1VX70_APLCA|nr:ankyrin repeat and SOCS box protein 8 [Aplysia californica]